MEMEVPVHHRSRRAFRLEDRLEVRGMLAGLWGICTRVLIAAWAFEVCWLWAGFTTFNVHVAFVTT
jgi:nitroreductase